MITFLFNTFILTLLLTAMIAMFFGMISILFTPFILPEGKRADGFIGGLVFCAIACMIFVVAKMISWM